MSFEDPKFAFSFDREQFTGRYPTREQALAAGLQAARQSPEAPGTVYVGKIILADPQACGHAEAVVDAMKLRARDKEGEAAYTYLATVSEHAVPIPPAKAARREQTLEVQEEGSVDYPVGL